MKSEMIEMEQKKEAETTVNISSLYRGDKLLITESKIDISPNEKVALIGRNGSGKSTLLETIYSTSKQLPLENSIDFEGNIEIGKNTSIGYLEQDVRLEFNGTVKEYIDNQVGERAEIYKRYEYLMDHISKDPIYEKDFSNILTQMEDYSLWNYPLEIDTVLNGLNIDNEILGRKIKSLSGGEATKIALASLLISKPNLILLDEPTNNLDLNNIRFLEDWLRKTKTSLVIVSHDREFLDKVIDTIWEIDEESKKILRYGGNYSFYENEKARQFEGRLRDFEEQERTKKRLQVDIKRLSKQANRFEGISNNDFYRAKGAKIAKSAKVRERRVIRELEKIGEPEKPKLPQFVLRETDELNGNILNINNLTFGYNNKNIIENFSLKINSGERISVSGPNGIGKSTLLKILVGEIPLQNVKLGEDVKIGYIPQSIIPNNPNQNILSYMREHTLMNEEDLVDTLGKVLFANPVYLNVKDFSVGELKRIQFAMMFASAPNFLVLDEPTNHLDIHTLNMLERTLKKFKHTILVVSHDREFLRRIGIKEDIPLK